MKKYKKILAFFLIFIFLPVCNVSAIDKGSSSGVKKGSAADNVILQGCAAGLIDTLGEAPFLLAENMLPGDTVKSSLTIKNDYDYSYRMTLTGLRVQDPRARNYDFNNNYELMKMIRVKIYYEGEDKKPLYDNELFDEYRETKTAEIDLGTFKPGEHKKLIAEAYFEPEMDDNYMNKALLVDWLFYAERVEEPEEKKTTDTDNPVIDKITNLTTNRIYPDTPFYKGIAKTGDKVIVPYIITCVITLVIIFGGLVFLFIKKNKGRKQDEKKKL